MEYKKLGNAKRLFSVGETVELVCPKCNEKVNMSIFKNRDSRLNANAPLLLESKNVYMLVCPNCASIFGVDNKKGDNFAKGEKLSIGNFDIKELDSIVY